MTGSRVAVIANKVPLLAVVDDDGYSVYYFDLRVAEYQRAVLASSLTVEPHA
jgi:hypothetical protein